MAIIWIEHVVHALTATVDRLLCLAGGALIGDGSPAEVLALPAVREVFLGTEVTAAAVSGADAGPRRQHSAAVRSLDDRGRRGPGRCWRSAI